MRALIAQLEPVPGDIARNVATVCGTIAGNPQVDLVAFPELFLGGVKVVAAEQRALPAGAPELEEIAEACATSGTALIVGFAEQLDAGIANSALAVDSDGTLSGVVRKAHLFAGESEVFQPARSIEPVDLLGVRVGVQICFDLEFPETARTLALLGASLLVTISANMEPFAPDHEVFASARAKENGLPHLYVNRAGEESGFLFTGRSCNLSAEGVLDQLGAGPGLGEVTISLEHHGDPRLDYRRQRRPDLYVNSNEGVGVG